MHARARFPLAVFCSAICALIFAAACGGGGDDGGDGRLSVATTVAPLRSIIENVGGEAIEVAALVPEGVNSHTFEPAPDAVREIEQADLIIINGLNLELPTLELAEANKRPDAPIIQLGNEAVAPDEYVYDFSFPESGGNPNPHLWTAPLLAGTYAEIARDALIDADPANEEYYRANAAAFAERMRELDAAFEIALATVPAEHRKLLTYHDSFPYFAPRYGYEVIGAIQPADFSEPSAREVAELIRQIERSGVPAIFGSEVFPSEVLETIAREAGAVQVSTLSDDDLPGEPGEPGNTLAAMLVENVRTIVEALGGDPSALDGLQTGNTWLPLASGS